MLFNNFIGNEKAKQQISNLYESGRLPHAIVLEGETGLGKRTLARDIAQALVCRAESEHPCGVCSQCVKAKKQLHPDIYEYSAPGGANSFHIDKIRDIIADVYITPNEADYKIYILGNAHCMNENAQNALLKILEEPPGYAVFILTAENRSALLETVLSRAVVISVEGVSPKLGAEFITGLNEDVDYNDAYNAVAALGGNIGRAYESIAGGRLQKLTALVDDIAQKLASNNEYDLLKAVAPLTGNRQDTAAVLGMLKTVLCDAVAGGKRLSGLDNAVDALKGEFSKQKLFALYNAAQELEQAANKNANSALLTTKICYSLRRAAGR